MECTWNYDIETVIANLKKVDDYKVKIKKNDQGVSFAIRRKRTFFSVWISPPTLVTGVGKLIANADNTTSCKMSFRYGQTIPEVILFAVLTFMIFFEVKDRYGISDFIAIITGLIYTIFSWFATYLLACVSPRAIDDAMRMERIVEFSSV